MLQDIVIPSLHAELYIDIEAGPFVEPMRFVWFQSIDGFTGYFLRQLAFRPWQNGLPGTVKPHLSAPWEGNAVCMESDLMSMSMDDEEAT